MNVIPAADGKQVVTYANGNTANIITEVLNCYKQSNAQVAQFAQQFKGSTVQDTCNNVWQFIKHNINYKIDPAGVQWIKTPARLWSDREGDCKSFSIMAASLLKHNGITPTFRFTTYTPGSTIPTHVYVVVKQKGKKEIVVDAVYNAFNAQKLFTYKKDYTMAQISRLSGIENTNPNWVYSTPQARKIAIQLYQLTTDMAAETAKYGGTLPAQRAALYNKWITKKAAELDKASKSNIGSEYLTLVNKNISTLNGISGEDDSDEKSVFDTLLAALPVIGGVISFFSNLFGGGKSDGEKMRDAFIEQGLSNDKIVLWYIVNKCNDLAYLHQCQEIIGNLAPSQGHGWKDETATIHTSVAKKFNDCVIQNYTKVGKSANDPEIAQLQMLWDLNRTIPDNLKTGSGTGTGSGNGSSVDDLEKNGKGGLGLLAAAAAAFTLLK